MSITTVTTTTTGSAGLSLTNPATTAADATTHPNPQLSGMRTTPPTNLDVNQTENNIFGTNRGLERTPVRRREQGSFAHSTPAGQRMDTPGRSSSLIMVSGVTPLKTPLKGIVPEKGAPPGKSKGHEVLQPQRSPAPLSDPRNTTDPNLRVPTPQGTQEGPGSLQPSTRQQEQRQAVAGDQFTPNKLDVPGGGGATNQVPPSTTPPANSEVQTVQENKVDRDQSSESPDHLGASSRSNLLKAGIQAGGFDISDLLGKHCPTFTGGNQQLTQG